MLTQKYSPLPNADDKFFHELDSADEHCTLKIEKSFQEVWNYKKWFVCPQNPEGNSNLLVPKLGPYFPALNLQDKQMASIYFNGFDN